MTVGIKVGLQPSSFHDLAKTNAPFCEVWYNILRKDEYNDLFKELRSRSMKIGLHFWGHLNNNIWANIAYPDSATIQQSLQLMYDTIDVACSHNFQYVNIHPSNNALVTINFETQSFELVSSPADMHVCEQNFFENVTRLNDYAKKQGILLTIETIPPKDTNGWHGQEPRLLPLDLYAPDNSLVVKAATEGFTVANDFGHTSCTVSSDDRSIILKKLFEITHAIASQTKLIHVGYIIPPYNGTDYHNHLDTDQFNSLEAIPNRSELIELLRLFISRDDVFVLAEPDGRHVENYFYLKQIVDSISK